MKPALSFVGHFASRYQTYIWGCQNSGILLYQNGQIGWLLITSSNFIEKMF